MSDGVLITGGAGSLGTALLDRAPAPMACAVTWRETPPQPGVTAHRVNLADAAAVRAVWETVRPRLVLHTAFSSNDMQNNIARATANVAEACAAVGARLVHVSSDLVLDGAHAPYDESAPVCPVMPYGEAKAAAEALARAAVPDVAIVRNSLILALAPLNPSSAWLVAALRRAERVTLFTDELRCPIAVSDLATLIWQIAALPRAAAAGVWNLAGPEALSRYAVGLLLARRFDLDVRLIDAVPTPTDVVRPRDLRLTTARADRALPHRPSPVSRFLAPVR